MVVPGARTGLLGAFTLATGRALGETVAVALVIGNSPYIAHSIKSPAATLPSLIVNNFGESTGTELAALFGAGLVLLVIGIAVNSVARWLVWSTAGSDAPGRSGPMTAARSTRRPTRSVERRRAVQAAAASSLRTAQARLEDRPRACAGLFLGIAIVPLVAVVAYVVVKGLPAWNVDFFTQSTVPEGIPGGGVWNAIVGTVVITAIAIAVTVPARAACAGSSWPSRTAGWPPRCGSPPT